MTSALSTKHTLVTTCQIKSLQISCT